MGDPKAKEFQKLLDELIVSMNRVATLDFLPWMSKILPASLVSWICRLDALDNFKEKMCIYFKVSKCSNGLLHSKRFPKLYGWPMCTHCGNSLYGNKLTYGKNFIGSIPLCNWIFCPLKHNRETNVMYMALTTVILYISWSSIIR